MRKRKKEIALKGKTVFLNFVLNLFYAVKSIAFPEKMVICISEGNTISPAMSRRKIKKVAYTICKTAVAEARNRSY